MPARQLVLIVGIAILLVIGAWSAAIAFGPWTAAMWTSGMVGIAVAAVAAMAGIAVMTPWKQRAIADWMTMWLAGTVFRIFVTPLAAFLLYSAASSSLAAKPFGLAVALTYIATLFVEAGVIAQYMKGISELPRHHGKGDSSH